VAWKDSLGTRQGFGTLRRTVSLGTDLIGNPPASRPVPYDSGPRCRPLATAARIDARRDTLRTSIMKFNPYPHSMAGAKRLSSFTSPVSPAKSCWRTFRFHFLRAVLELPQPFDPNRLPRATAACPATPPAGSELPAPILVALCMWLAIGAGNVSFKNQSSASSVTERSDEELPSASAITWSSCFTLTDMRLRFLLLPWK